MNAEKSGAGAEKAGGSSRKRFEKETRAVVKCAKKAALHYRHTHVTPEHLLLGLLETDDKTPRLLLASTEARPEQIRALIDRQLRPGSVVMTEEQLGFSERAKRVLAKAEEEARRDGKKQAAPKHLLLGLYAVDNTVCSAVLRAVDLSPEKVRGEK